MAVVAIKKLPLSVFSIILNLKPILVMLIGLLAKIESLTLKKVLLILISFVGTALIVSPGSFSELWRVHILGQTSTSSAEHGSADLSKTVSVLNCDMVIFRL